MQEIDLTDGRVRAAGIAELESTPDGLVLHRLPAWARRQHHDPMLGLIETMPTGGRLEFSTGARTIELDVHLTMVQLGDAEPIPGAFDLVADGEVVDQVTSRDGTVIAVDPVTGRVDFVPGEATTVRFAIPPGTARTEIWLPHAASIRLISMRADGVVAPPSGGPTRRWTHYGSSISHCFEAVRPTGAWPAVAARAAGVDLQSCAFAGQCHLDPFVARTIGRQPADLISAKLGINVVNGDTLRERTFVPALHGFLDTVREHHPEVPLLLITPITCPVAEDHPGPTTTVGGMCRVVDRPADLALGALTLRRIRELDRQVVADRRADDPNLHLLEGTELFGPDDVGDLPDGLHPNAAGYQRMGERFVEAAFAPGRPFADR